MGQCVSRKAAGAFAASTAFSHNRPTKMQKNRQVTSPDDENNKKLPSPVDQNKKSSLYSKGMATSFGFKRRPVTAPSIAANPTAARRLANTGNQTIDRRDRNGNEDVDTDALTNNIAPTGRSTPRLPPPKKEANATKVSRFGFRQGTANRLNKVADLNSAPMEFGQNPTRVISPTEQPIGNTNFRKQNNQAKVTDVNRNTTRPRIGIPQIQSGRFTLQSTQLPRPEPVRLIETKSAKTLANNNKKTAGMYQQQTQHHEDSSSKDGSLTEDSGVGSHLSGFVGETDGIPEVARFDSSPTFGVRRNNKPRSRNLEVLTSGDNSFDVRDLDGSVDSLGTPPPLPQLPSAFNINGSRKMAYQPNTGLVRERTVEYQRRLEWDNNRGRKISVTSSEGYSDEYGEEEKTFRDRFRSEKTFIKIVPHKTFLKTRVSEIKDAESSPPSSDEHEWGLGGEAMADDVSISISSSDESRDKKFGGSQSPPVPASTAVIGTALQSLMSSSMSMSTTFVNSKEVKNVLLTIEDPKFAAVAAANKSAPLIDDEMLSPVESLISYSESDEILKKRIGATTSSESKDINEKLTPPSPGTPTNTTDSLSLSDGKDDFLIDDEIADQPALVFEDGGVANETFSLSQNNSDNTTTIVGSTPKSKRYSFPTFEGSPLSLRNKRLSSNRTVSLDTLSPCESIASDDLMMDYDVSQSSGLDDIDRRASGGYSSLNETMVLNTNLDSTLTETDSTFSLNKCEKLLKSASRPRLLSRSRTGTPNSIPDSPRSLDGRAQRTSRSSAISSPIKSRIICQTGYESDDSIRLDRANHTAMKQDIINIKTMLLKLRRVLNESNTHNPFDSQHILTNGFFNNLCHSANMDLAQSQESICHDSGLELAELRRQILFLQGQLEDKEKIVQNLQDQVIKLANENYQSQSAPASTVATDHQNMCNAATQTERIRPISAGPSLFTSPNDGSSGSLVSANERKSRLYLQHNEQSHSKKTPSRLWRQPGEPPSPPRYASSSSAIPKRATSRTRTPVATPT